MSDVDRLLAAFETGELLRPSAEVPGLVDLARALAVLAGAPGLALTPGGERIVEAIGESDHLVFVLADGLGTSLLQSLPADALLRRRLAMELRTVFPSTTAVALTTLATGEWPARHAVTGWWTYVRQIDGAATILPFEKRAGETPLEELGVTAEDVFPLPSLVPTLGRDALSLFPAAIADSAYSRYSSGGTARRAYRSLRHAVDLVVRRIEAAESPTYTYLYTPRVDSAAHDYGTADRHVAAEVATLDQQVARLVDALAGRARVVLSADHGLLDAPPSQRHLIRASDALVETLRVPPSYDARVMCFHLHDGAHAQFRAAVAERFDESVFLLSVDEAEELQLFGPGPLSPLTRERLGDFITIARGANAIGFAPATGGRGMLKMASQHSGLTPQEMLVPLVVA